MIEDDDNVAKKGIVKKATISAKDPHTRRLIMILAPISVLGLLIACLSFWKLWEWKQDQVDAGAEVVAAVRAQCADNFEDPPDLQRICELADSAQQKIESGPQGPPGIQGPKGDPGPMGPIGPTGDTGDTGANGKNGKNGATGPAGVNGVDGTDGATGPQGPVGEPGPAGPQGPQGPAGEPGKDGVDGTDGVSGVPFTFTFSVPGRGNQPPTNYTCTVTQPNSQVNCVPA